jgi:hypothetical protein
MKIYNCKVRLHANPNDEVRRNKVTAAEIRVLRKMHGEDAVVEITEVAEVERSQDQERDRLERAYGVKAVTALFGVPIVKIDAELPADPMAEIETAKPKPIPVVERVKLPDDLPPPAEAKPVADVFA